MSALVPSGEKQADVAPDFVTVEVKTVNGSGCPAGTAAVAAAADSTEWSAIVYAPCGEQRLLNANAELRVTAGTGGGTSYMVMDSTDSNVSTTYHFSWKRC